MDNAIKELIDSLPVIKYEDPVFSAEDGCEWIERSVKIELGTTTTRSASSSTAATLAMPTTGARTAVTTHGSRTSRSGLKSAISR